MSANKGGKKKRRGKNTNSNFVKPFVEPSEGQYFAKALKPLGSLKVQLEVYLYEVKQNDKKGNKIFDIDKVDKNCIMFKKQEMIGHVRGSMRKREYVNPNDIVLVSLREFVKDSKVVDIVMKYPSGHHYLIKKHKLCPEDIMFNSSEGDDNINFDDENDTDTDEDIETAMNFIQRNKTMKRTNTNSNDNYLAGLDLPSLDDEFEYEDTSNREVDDFGNLI